VAINGVKITWARICCHWSNAAATAWSAKPKEAEDLPRTDLERDVLKRNPVPESFAQSMDRQRRRVADAMLGAHPPPFLPGITEPLPASWRFGGSSGRSGVEVRGQWHRGYPFRPVRDA
jgi:hypothetical protein